MLTDTTGTVLHMPARDAFADHLDQEWPLPLKARMGKERHGRASLRAGFKSCPDETKSCPDVPSDAKPAVTRWLQMGKRVIPDGPRVDQFIDHRLHVCRADAELGIVDTTDLYVEYVAMCDLGGWKPIGRNTFFARIEAAGYPRIRARMPNGDRYWLYNFTVPPTA